MKFHRPWIAWSMISQRQPRFRACTTATITDCVPLPQRCHNDVHDPTKLVKTDLKDCSKVSPDSCRSHYVLSTIIAWFDSMRIIKFRDIQFSQKGWKMNSPYCYILSSFSKSRIWCLSNIKMKILFGEVEGKKEDNGSDHDKIKKDFSFDITINCQ